MGGGLRFALLAPWLLAGCSKWTAGDLGELRVRSGTVKSKGDGYATVKVPVEAGETAVQVVGRINPKSGGEGLELFVDWVLSPDDELVFDAQSTWSEPRAISGGAIPASMTTFGWPALPAHDELTEGVWTFEVGVLQEGDDGKNYLTKNAWVDIDVLLKQDADFEGGAIDVNLVFADGTGDDQEILRATREATEIWADIYATMGIEVAFTENTWPDGDLEPVGFGSFAVYEDIAEAFPGDHVNVVVLDRFEGVDNLYGIAGGIPGPLVTTGRSAVAISAVQNAGVDLVFTDNEVRLYAETMAHEVGHFLGLFHPVEISYEAWDVLADTPECDNEQDCIDILGDNLMYPYPLCSQLGCLAQQHLSDEQGAVANRYAGVR